MTCCAIQFGGGRRGGLAGSGADDQLAVWVGAQTLEGTPEAVWDNARLLLGIGDGNTIGGGAGSTRLYAIGDGHTLGALDAATKQATLGHDNRVDGDFSYAIGERQTVDGGNSLAIGTNDNRVPGSDSYTLGERNLVEGNDSLAVGERNTVRGNDAQAIGEANIVDASGSTAVGARNTIEGGDSFAFGEEITITPAALDSTGLGEQHHIESPRSLGAGHEHRLEGLGSSAYAWGQRVLVQHPGAVFPDPNIPAQGIGAFLHARHNGTILIGSGLPGIIPTRLASDRPNAVQLGIGTVPALTVEDELVTIGEGNNAARLRFRGVHTALPPDPPIGEADLFILDTGAPPVQFHVRYNQGGTIRTGSLNLT